MSIQSIGSNISLGLPISGGSSPNLSSQIAAVRQQLQSVEQQLNEYANESELTDEEKAEKAQLEQQRAQLQQKLQQLQAQQRQQQQKKNKTDSEATESRSEDPFNQIGRVIDEFA